MASTGFLAAALAAASACLRSRAVRTRVARRVWRAVLAAEAGDFELVACVWAEAVSAVNSRPRPSKGRSSWRTM